MRLTSKDAAIALKVGAHADTGIPNLGSAVSLSGVAREVTIETDSERPIDVSGIGDGSIVYRYNKSGEVRGRVQHMLVSEAVPAHMGDLETDLRGHYAELSLLPANDWEAPITIGGVIERWDVRVVDGQPILTQVEIGGPYWVEPAP